MISCINKELRTVILQQCQKSDLFKYFLKLVILRFDKVSISTGGMFNKIVLEFQLSFFSTVSRLLHFNRSFKNSHDPVRCW